MHLVDIVKPGHLTSTYIAVYDSTFVRHWDQWLYPGKRTQLFAVELNSGEQVSDWSLKGEVRNLLKGTTLESPVGVLSTTEDYSVSSTHVIFTAKDPDQNHAWHTKQDIYLVPLDGHKAPNNVTKGDHGSTSSPVFSFNNKRIAWLQMNLDGYESDRKIIHVANIEDDCDISEEYVLLEDWTLSPSMIRFTGDDKSLIGIVEESEHKIVFKIDLDIWQSSDQLDKIRKLTLDGSVEYIEAFEGGILATVSSFRGPNDVYLITSSHLDIVRADMHRLTDFGQRKGSSLASINFGRKSEQIKFSGHKGRTSYGWVHYPPNFDEKSTYPLAVLIHGGPAAAFNNAWSTRWNPLVFTAQGFFVITLDPAGSTGFGQDYQNENRFNWGGAPFNDIIAGVKYTLEQFKRIDPERVVAAGNSYGGYMMNWIQGHNEDKLFKG